MAEDAPTPAGAQGGSRPVRFEATLHPGDRVESLEAAVNLDVDRVPAARDEVRVLVTAEEAAELVERGYQVHLERALPIRPLDPTLVADEDVEQWLSTHTEGIERQDDDAAGRA